MSRQSGGRVLAIGLDATEPALIRQMIAQDEMPALKSSLAEGRWIRVQSSAHIGSGSVWPTFITGKEPPAHGVYDWSQTRAFSLVNEQHGSIRVNLIGREARGTVPAEEYEDTCRQVEKALLALRTEDGKPL